MKKYVKASEEPRLYEAFDRADDANAAMIDAILNLESYTTDSHVLEKAEALYNRLVDFSVTLGVAMDELEG